MARTKTLRDLIRETELSPAHLVQPMFVVSGEGVREPVPSMPGVERFSISELVGEAGEIADAGIGAVILFGVPAEKDENGLGRLRRRGRRSDNGPGSEGGAPDLLVITDVCLCEYTSHGHCGVVRENGEVDNDVTLELLAGRRSRTSRPAPTPSRRRT